MEFDRADHEVPEELLANTFASYLLMPRHAVADAFARREVQPAAADPIDMYSVACQLGVGYETLLKHLRWSLDSLSSSRLTDLCAIPPKEIRRAVLGTTPSSHLVIADAAWRTVPIDMEVGDFAVLPNSIRLAGSSAGVAGDCLYGTVVEALRPGLTQAVMNDPDGFAAMIRVSRRQFTGRGLYRHLEDPDEDE